jgi:branched-chain amino acid aminotransferase/4-amino-4-deoxychorismate lyase
MSAGMIPADDRGLLLGDGLFETLLAVDGRLVRFERHLERMRRGCAVVGVRAPEEPVARAAAARALNQAGLLSGRAAVRLTLTAGAGRGLDRPFPAAGRLIAQASASAPPAPRPLSLATASVRRNQASPLSRVKSLSYLDNILARREARDAGAEEALMLNGSGELACAAAANLFWVQDGRLVTPALECGVLDGIFRAVVIEAAEAMGVQTVQTASSPEALGRAEGVFLTNSLIGVRPVGALDGRPLPASRLVETLANRCG